MTNIPKEAHPVIITIIPWEMGCLTIYSQNLKKIVNSKGNIYNNW